MSRGLLAEAVRSGLTTQLECRSSELRNPAVPPIATKTRMVTARRRRWTEWEASVLFPRPGPPSGVVRSRRGRDGGHKPGHKPGQCEDMGDKGNLDVPVPVQAPDAAVGVMSQG